MDYESIKKHAKAVSEQVLTVRRTIHSRPELSFEEHETADYIAAQLTEAGILFRRIAGTGILARIEGHGDLQRCVVLRADTDALPIWEETGLECASRHDGVMHACGHDMHTACLLGALLVLNRHKSEIAGTVFGLFQPGEEVCPGGASMVMAEDPFRDYRVVAFVGEHVAPEMAVGNLGFRSGKYMASSDELWIEVHGTGGHGALPHTMTDPVVAAAALITSLQQVVSRNNNATIPTVLSIGRVMANGATNVIPPVVQVAGTLRTMDERWRAPGQTAHSRDRRRSRRGPLRYGRSENPGRISVRGQRSGADRPRPQHRRQTLGQGARRRARPADDRRRFRHLHGTLPQPLFQARHRA